MYDDYIRQFQISPLSLSPSPPLSPSADAIVLQLLLERDVVGVIVRMMEALPSHSSAQQVHNTVV